MGDIIGLVYTIAVVAVAMAAFSVVDILRKLVGRLGEVITLLETMAPKQNATYMGGRRRQSTLSLLPAYPPESEGEDSDTRAA